MVGVASRSDEPSWARECLRKFVIADGVSMMDVVTEVLSPPHDLVLRCSEVSIPFFRGVVRSIRGASELSARKYTYARCYILMLIKSSSRDARSCSLSPLVVSAPHSFAKLQEKTGIPFKRMCFFDDGKHSAHFRSADAPLQ